QLRRPRVLRRLRAPHRTDWALVYGAAQSGDHVRYSWPGRPAHDERAQAEQAAADVRGAELRCGTPTAEASFTRRDERGPTTSLGDLRLRLISKPQPSARSLSDKGQASRVYNGSRFQAAVCCLLGMPQRAFTTMQAESAFLYELYAEFLVRKSRIRATIGCQASSKT